MSIEQSGKNESLIDRQVLTHYENQKQKWSHIKDDLDKTIEEFKLGSGRNSIDFAENDALAAFPDIHKTIPEFPNETDYASAPKREFDRMLMMD